MNRVLFGLALIMIGCSSDPLVSGARALDEGQHVEAVKLLRQAASGGDEKATKVYRKALSEYQSELRKASSTAEACDAAVSALTGIEGFGLEQSDEGDLLTQALVCAARHRARKGQIAEATKIVVDGVKVFPGFSPDSPVLLKSLHEPAIKAARSGGVMEATALAQAFFGAGQQGFALSLLDLLESAGPGPDDILPVLRERAKRAKLSDAAVGLAAGYAAWHGGAKESTAWFGDLAAKDREAGAGADATANQFKQRSEEAYWIAEARGPACEVVGGAPVATKIPSIASTVAIPVEGGFLLVWMEGSTPPPADPRARSKASSPEQTLKLIRVGLDGQAGQPVVVAQQLPSAGQAPEGDVQAAFASRNFETSLGLSRCGGGIELAARGAPRGEWVRAVIGGDGAVISPPAALPSLGQDAQMPSEDVWWNLGCSNDQLVHLWLADTQLMRLAWFADGQVTGEVANMRIPGFSPSFEVVGMAEGATLVVWIDIMGEGISQIIRVAIPEDHSVPTGEEDSAISIQPVVESIESRTEHMRLERLGDRYALAWYPQRSDISLRWLDLTGQPQGETASLVQLRPDALDVRFDAGTSASRLGLAWTERLTDQWASIHFVSVDGSGRATTRPQRLAGLVRPDVPPLVVGSGPASFMVAWVDRSQAEGEALRLSVLRCDGDSGGGAHE